MVKSSGVHASASQFSRRGVPCDFAQAFPIVCKRKDIHLAKQPGLAGLSFATIRCGCGIRMGGPANAGDRKVMKRTAKAMIVVARKDMEGILMVVVRGGSVESEIEYSHQVAA